jgi:hypothetical protein
MSERNNRKGVRKEIGDNAELTITTNGMFLKNSLSSSKNIKSD